MCGLVKFSKLGIVIGGLIGGRMNGWMVGDGTWVVGRCSVDWDEVV